MPPAIQTRRVQIVVNSSGAPELKNIADKLGLLGQNTKKLADGFGTLSAATTSFLGLFGAREIVGFADEILNMNNKLLALTGTQELATKALQDLTTVARDTNQSLDSTVTTFTRMSLAVKDVGISTATMIDLTKVIGNTFRLSGASIEETTNATIQLSQAFSLGVLRGQDLRSVMSQNVVLTQLLRKAFGTDLLKAAEKGLITVPKLMKILFDNMEAINASAKKMVSTFSQTGTKGLDAFKLKIGELAQTMGAAGIFQDAMNVAIKNMGFLVAIGTVLAVNTLPSIIKSVISLAGQLGLLSAASLAFTVPWLVLIAALKSTGESMEQLIVDFKIGVEITLQFFSTVGASLDEFTAKYSLLSDERKQALRNEAADLRALASLHEARLKDLRVDQDSLAATIKTQETAADQAKRIAGDLGKAAKSLSTTATPKEEFAALNAEFLKTGDIEKYNSKLRNIQIDKIRYQFKEGKTDIFQFNKAMLEIHTEEFNQQLNSGVISLETYRKKIEGAKIDELNEKFVTGKISVISYHEEIAKLGNEFRPGSALVSGASQYIESVGTLTQGIAGFIKGTFSHLEDALVDFVKKGKFNFADFTSAVLDDLTRVIIRASIIQPLAQGLLSSALPATTGTVSAAPSYIGNVAAHGMAFSSSSNIIPYAKGGIVGSPTLFNHSGGTGLMGEKGAEAILPLSRGSGGDLGVKATVTPVTINIVNQTGSDVQQTETTGPGGEKSIDILITNKVRDGIMSGRYDKTMKSAYGLNRRGG